MVGVASSNLVAPTKFLNGIKDEAPPSAGLFRWGVYKFGSVYKTV